MGARLHWPRKRLERLGKAPDTVLARVWGISVESVRNKRKALGITTWGRAQARHAEVDKLAGQLPDVEIAGLLGISAAIVFRRRMALSRVKGELIESPPAARKRHTLEQAQAAAAQHGGRCLSRKPGGLLVWRCKRGHTFEATAHRIIRRRQWCGRCSGQVKE